MPRALLLVAAAALAACGDPSSSAPRSAGTPPEAAAPDGEVAVPADSGAVAPRLSLGPDGTPLLSWVEPTATGHALRAARWTGAGWAAAETVAQGDDWFVNWADTPGVIAFADGRPLAHTLPRHPDGGDYAYDVAVRMGGRRQMLNTDGVAAEHGFVSGAALGDRLGLVWLDGRNQAGHGHHSGAMTLRYAALAPDGTRSDEVVLDERTCDCCPTATAATPSGLVVAYRDRSDAEVRDVAVVRQVDGVWTAPTIPHPDGWRIEGCPVNGPALAARGDRVALAWFAGGDATQVSLAVSDAAGSSWGDRVRIDAGDPIGRVGVALLPDGSAVVSWLEAVGDTAELRVRRVAGGTAGAPRTVATVDAGRSSGVPVIAAVGDRALVAWTDPASATVRTALVSP